MTWLRKKTIPGFAPRGDEVIGTTRNGQGVTISQEFWRWLSLLATRLQNNVAAAGTIQMTAAAVEPEGWLFLNGQTVDANLYPDLEGIFGSSGGIITLPDYSNRIAMGAGETVALNGTAGAATVTLTRNEMPKHNHGVSDPGHLHGAVDRGHGHGLQLDSHTHEGTFADHTHDVTTSNHAHSIVPTIEIAVQSGTGTSVAQRDTPGTTGNAGGETIVSTGPSADGLSIDQAEVTGTVIKSQADIRVHKAKTGITTLDDGEGQPFSIIPPVFGVNWMVKT